MIIMSFMITELFVEYLKKPTQRYSNFKSNGNNKWYTTNVIGIFYNKHDV